MKRRTKANELLEKTVNSFLAMEDVMDSLNALEKLHISASNIDDDLVDDIDDAIEIIEKVRERIAGNLVVNVEKVNAKLENK